MASAGFQIPYPDLSVVLGGGGPAPIAGAKPAAAVASGAPAVLRATELRETDGEFGPVYDMIEVDEVLVMAGGRSYDATFLLSSDLKHWVKREGLDNGRRAVLKHDDKLWEVGENGTFASSADWGKTWNVVETGFEECIFSVVEYGGALWLCGDEGYLARYADGVLEKLDVGGVDVRLLDLIVVGNRLYVLGYDGHLRVLDPDARTFVADKELGDTPLCALAQTRSGAFIVVGDGGSIWRSDDGSSFVRMEETPAEAKDLEAVAVLADGRVLIVGDEGLILISGDDGWSWTAIDGCDDSCHLWSILALGDATLLGGDDGALWKLAPKGDKAWADKADQFDGDEDAVESSDDDDDEDDEDSDDEDDDDGEDADADADGDAGCTVMLNVTGENKIAVIKIVREVTGLGLKESLDLVQAAPSRVKAGLTRAQADAIVSQLEAVGADAEIT
jgi:ribosomal protein L7/L12/photosystem II stability/assembly factor-like uncharacterized protein